MEICGAFKIRRSLSNLPSNGIPNDCAGRGPGEDCERHIAAAVGAQCQGGRLSSSLEDSKSEVCAATARAGSHFGY